MSTKAERRQATQNRIKAMTHPLRAESFRLIRDRAPISPARIARELNAKVEDVSYHVRKLVEYDCAEEVDTRQVRGAVEHFYRATAQHLIDVGEWEELAIEEPLVAEGLVDEFMQNIVDDFAVSRKAGVVGRDEQFHITRTPHQVDERGLRDALAAFEVCRLRMLEIETECIERDGGKPAIRLSSSLVLFKMPFAR